MPGPDDPPSTVAPTSTTTTRSAGVHKATVRTQRTAEGAVPVPSPDAPLVPVPVTAPKTSVTRTVTIPAPDVTRSAPRSTHAAPVATRTTRTAAPTRSAPHATVERTTARPSQTPAAEAKAHAKTKKPKIVHRAAPVRHRQPGREPRTGVPRDAVRLGLPAAALGGRTDDAELNSELLVAAALLLAAAAGGSLLLGITARNAARHA
jgi:hypothetical protein